VMRRLIILAAALATLAMAGAAHAASSAAALYNRGNDLYEQGKFEKAAESYRQAIEHGAGGADLYYNLGNAELRAGRLGPAVAAYIKAKAIAPRDPDIEFNLQYARNKIQARPPGPEAGPFTRAFNALAGHLSAAEWTFWCMALYWAAAIFGTVLIVSSSGKARRAFRALLYAALIFLVLSIPFAAVRVKRDLLTPRAVIMAESVTARSGPGEDNAALFDLHQGVDVVVGQCESGWCRVSAAGGFIGWIPGPSFERI